MAMEGSPHAAEELEGRLMTQLMAFVFVSMAAGYLAGLFTLSIKHEKEVHDLNIRLITVTESYNRLYNVILTRGLAVPAPSLNPEWLDACKVHLTKEDRTTVQSCTSEGISGDGTA